MKKANGRIVGFSQNVAYRRRDVLIVAQSPSASAIEKSPLRIVTSFPPASPPEPIPTGTCRACGSPECVTTISIAHAPTEQAWQLELCASDFERFRQWLAVITYCNEQEAAKRG
jgi:hypothetical protein